MNSIGHPRTIMTTFGATGERVGAIVVGAALVGAAEVGVCVGVDVGMSVGLFLYHTAEKDNRYQILAGNIDSACTLRGGDFA